MPNDTYLSFYLSTSRLHIFSKAIIEIGNPKFIRFLVIEDGQSMIMDAYHKKISNHTECQSVQKENGKWRYAAFRYAVLSKIGCTGRTENHTASPEEHTQNSDWPSLILLQQNKYNSFQIIKCNYCSDVIKRRSNKKIFSKILL